MTFLNYPLLWGLIGIGIPIVIHLLNRRRASVVQWGAMRFLLASLASRNRRILLEEIVLMAVRCLAVGLIAAAMARPLLPSGGTSWAIALTVLPAAAILGAVAAVMWSRRAVRWACLAAAAALALAAGLAVAQEDSALGRKWASAGTSQDIVLVIDGSMSMTLRGDGQTTFQRALDEARAVVGACRPSDTVAVILGGTFPREVIVPGISNHKEVLARLDAMAPSNGSLRAIASLSAAGASLSKGHNAGKKIILITDGQSAGWDLPGPSTGSGQGMAVKGAARNEDRWRWLASNLTPPGGAPPRVVCRFLPAPERVRNLCVDEVKFSRNVVGADRPVRIDVKVSNTGTVASAPLPVELLVEGQPVGRQGLDEIAPGSSQVVRFLHRFERPGARRVEARLVWSPPSPPDDLPGDDSAAARLNVLETLPVLIVEGAPSGEPLGGAADFLDVALSPGPSRPPAARRPASTSAAVETLDLVRPTLVEASRLAAAGDFSAYAVVILAGVPMLPEATARELAAFVQRGGGMLIVPGEFRGAAGGALPAPFYETWSAAGGRPLAPARLVRRIANLPAPAHLAPRTFSHPALEVLSDPARTDAGAVLVRSYWELQIDDKDPDVRIGGSLDTGHPLLVERKVGAGRVLMVCASLDHRDTNLPGIKPCYVPLVHELVYYLSGTPAIQGDFESGQEVSMEVPPSLGDPAGWPTRWIEVLTPSGVRRPAQLVETAGSRRLNFADTDSPGIYRFLPPASASKPATAPASDDAFFAVLNQPRESRLDRLREADLQAAQKFVPLDLAQTTQELTAMVHGGTPGTEIWKGLVACAALALLVEIALTQWIARRRKTHTALPIAFGQDVLDVQSFRERAKEMLAAGTGDRGTGTGKRDRNAPNGFSQSTSQPVNESTNR